MIYGRFGQQVEVVRMAILDDVRKLDCRKPDKADREAVKLGSYVVVRDDATERLYHIAYLRADGGSKEISEAVEQLSKKCPHCGEMGKSWDHKPECTMAHDKELA